MCSYKSISKGPLGCFHVVLAHQLVNKVALCSAGSNKVICFTLWRLRTYLRKRWSRPPLSQYHLLVQLRLRSRMKFARALTSYLPPVMWTRRPRKCNCWVSLRTRKAAGCALAGSLQPDRLLQLLHAATDSCSSFRPRQIAERPTSGAESDTLCIASLSQGNNYLRCFRFLFSASRCFLARISCKVCRACDTCSFDCVFALGAFLRSNFLLSGISRGMLW